MPNSCLPSHEAVGSDNKNGTNLWPLRCPADSITLHTSDNISETTQLNAFNETSKWSHDLASSLLPKKEWKMVIKSRNVSRNIKYHFKLSYRKKNRERSTQREFIWLLHTIKSQMISSLFQRKNLIWLKTCKKKFFATQKLRLKAAW